MVVLTVLSVPRILACVQIHKEELFGICIPILTANTEIIGSELNKLCHYSPKSEACDYELTGYPKTAKVTDNNKHS